MKVYLGGTMNGSKWRENLVIPHLKIEFFNPVSEIWNEETYKRDLKEHENADFRLYFITPKMDDFYTVIDVIDDSNKKPDKTLFCFLNIEDGVEFSKHQTKSLVAIGKMVQRNGGRWFESVEELLGFLNAQQLK